MKKKKAVLKKLLRQASENFGAMQDEADKFLNQLNQALQTDLMRFNTINTVGANSFFADT